MSDRTLRTAGIAAVAAALWLGSALPAAAEEYGTPTAISAVSTPEAIPFGTDWVVQYTVMQDDDWGVPAGSGSLDVYVEGVAGAYAADLPVLPGGVVFFAQPDAQPLLPAGDHRVTAVFTPFAGTYLASSQTSEPIVLTVTPLVIEPGFTITGGPSADDSRAVRLTMGPSAAQGPAPAGTWSIRVRDEADREVFAAMVPQSADERTLSVPLDAVWEHGADYRVSVEFLADPAIAGGIVSSSMPDRTFSTPEQGLAEVLGEPVPMPLPALVGAAAGLVLLVLAAAALPVLLHRRRVAAAPQAEPQAEAHPV
ncbi:MAG TPA: hypothetical protein VIL55_15775 [Naasia sp.]